MWRDSREVLAEKAIQHQTAGIQSACIDGGDESKDGSDRENVAACRVVTPFEEFGHGINTGANIVRQEKQQKQAIHYPDIPIAGGEHDPEFVCSTDIGDELFAADVGRDH